MLEMSAQQQIEQALPTNRQQLFWCLALGLCLFTPLPTRSVRAETIPQIFQNLGNAEDIEQQGKILFEQQEFTAASRLLEQAVQQYQLQGQPIKQAVALSNLALIYEQLGQWPAANQTIKTSVDLLTQDSRKVLGSTLAQVLNVRGQLQLAQGQAKPALDSWEQAEKLFSKYQDFSGVNRSRINQAQALQSLGLYRRAILMLTDITSAFPEGTHAPDQIIAWRSLGDVLRVGGELNASQEALERSLAMAQQLQQPADVAAARLSLGNTLSALGETEQSEQQYALAATGSGAIPLQVQLNQLKSRIESQDWSTAQALWRQAQEKLQTQVPSRPTVYAHLNLASSLTKWREVNTEGSPSALDIAQVVATAQSQAKALGDTQSESFAVGALGALYESEERWSEAEGLTRQALGLAQDLPEGAFRWQWQLGRLLKAQGDREGAISAYKTAVETLQSLRQDLVAINPEVQFSFREGVEPIYRQLVALLLDVESAQPSQKNLETARLTIESLQLAELDNFFREACLDANPVLIDELDQSAAVIYPIILPDRLAVIVSAPGQGLHLYTTDVDKKKIERTVYRFRRDLGQSNGTLVLPLGQQLYDWLLRPVLADLAASEIETLVFVQDGVLRNIPMAALHDGSQYVVENYAVALTPGLQLIAPQPLASNRPHVLAAGVSDAQKLWSDDQTSWSALPHVLTEIESIGQYFKVRPILNQRFTPASFEEALGQDSFPVVHLATHGQFSSDLDKTYLVAWGDQINASQLKEVLQTNELQSGGIELLVLSACETATGDERAALGLAGLAMRSGARSTLATLWQVNDEATAILMDRFYKILGEGGVTKSAALQQSQISMLKDFSHHKNPYFWAAYVLVGNWR